MVQYLTAEEIIRYISDAKKSTLIKVYLNGNFEGVTYPESLKVFGSEQSKVIFCETDGWRPFYKAHDSQFEGIEIEMDRHSSAVPLKDLTSTDARTELGALIREQTITEDGAAAMMGATISIGAVVGKGTMIDMDAALGGYTTTGKNVHVGAGAVLAGMVEPPNASPVVIESDVLTDTNAVILESVCVSKSAIVAADATVTQDTPASTVIVGIPAKVIEQASEVRDTEKETVAALRKLND